MGSIDFGTVTFEGKTYTLTQDAYSAYNSRRNTTQYEAAAIGPDGKRYIVTWEIFANFDPWTDEDESCACDWDSPASAELI